LASTIAAHYESARAPLPAARWWLAHAQALTDLGSFAHAAETIARAVSLLAHEEDAPARRELQARAIVQRSMIAHYRGQTAEALAHLEAALVACCEFPALYAEALARKAHALFICDRYAEAHQAASQSLAIAHALGDPQAAVSALNIRGLVALQMGYRRRRHRGPARVAGRRDGTAVAPRHAELDSPGHGAGLHTGLRPGATDT
jgi:tetratricopeptide (TPR) repeat protein